MNYTVYVYTIGVDSIADAGDYVSYNESLTIPPNSGVTVTDVNIGRTISDVILENVETFYAHITSDTNQIVIVVDTSNNATVRIFDGIQSG